MVVPRVQEQWFLRLQKMLKMQLVGRRRYVLFLFSLICWLGMYHGFDWYGRTLEVREVWRFY